MSRSKDYLDPFSSLILLLVKVSWFLNNYYTNYFSSYLIYCAVNSLLKEICFLKQNDFII